MPVDNENKDVQISPEMTVQSLMNLIGLEMSETHGKGTIDRITIDSRGVVIHVSVTQSVRAWTVDIKAVREKNPDMSLRPAVKTCLGDDLKIDPTRLCLEITTAYDDRRAIVRLQKVPVPEASSPVVRPEGKSYTVRRDDATPQIVTCPKCNHHIIKNHHKKIPFTLDHRWISSLFQCEGCGMYFTFDTEDGVRAMDPDRAVADIAKGYQDRQSDGKDAHGHNYYVMFPSCPPIIDADRVDELQGFVSGCDEDPRFSQCQNDLSQFAHLGYMHDHPDVTEWTGLADYVSEFFSHGFICTNNS